MITCAKFSRESPMFLYTTTKGQIRLCDFRESSNFQSQASIEFTLKPRKSIKSINAFDQWLNVVSDASFIPGNQNYIISRDYLSAKLWDLRKGNNRSTSMIVDSANYTKPVYSAQVTDYLERNLANLMESDQLDD